MPVVMRNGVPTRISLAEYNEELAKHKKQVLGVDETNSKLKHYTQEDLGKIWVNGQEFSGMAYQGLLTVNTKTYVEEPKRANDGSIPNINDYDTFVVPRCKVNFKYFNIEDYQRLCNAVQSNEFTVRYYDKQFNEFVVHKMYCEPEEMVKLYNVETNIIGVLDYEVSFIGTLNDLDYFKLTYQPNGATIAGNPALYNPDTTYQRGNKVYLEDGRYFEAIWFENTFENHDLSDTNYWKQHNLYEFSLQGSYTYGEVVYQSVDSGRNYYIAIYNGGYFTGRPLSDTQYWKLISAKVYSSETTYTSNKTSMDDIALGQFALISDGSAIYEAIYYNDIFDDKDPTNSLYWKQLAVGKGIEVKWGNSLVISDPEELFEYAGKNSYKWNSKPDGTGFTYYPTQSINVFKNLTLYAIWE